MIPELIAIEGSPWPVLPIGIHRADLSAIKGRYASNVWRRALFSGLVKASRHLASAGCRRLYLDGSFVTGKPKPGDYDVCWDLDNVDLQLLGPVFEYLTNNHRATQKAKYGGEFFPSSYRATADGKNFLEFFQIDKASGKQKGIILVSLANDPMLKHP